MASAVARGDSEPGWTRPREGAEITMTMKKSEGKGLVLFDVARGRITKSDLDLKLDLEVKRLNNAVQQSMRQKTSMVLAE